MCPWRRFAVSECLYLLLGDIYVLYLWEVGGCLKESLSNIYGPSIEDKLWSFNAIIKTTFQLP